MKKQEHEQLLTKYTASTSQVEALEAEKQDLMHVLTEAVDTADDIKVHCLVHLLCGSVW